MIPGVGLICVWNPQLKKKTEDLEMENIACYGSKESILLKWLSFLSYCVSWNEFPSKFRWHSTRA